MASNTTRVTRRSIANVSVAQPDVMALTTLDRLVLAQAVYELGANSWSAVAKLLTRHPLLQRPKSFFTPQSCQAMYIHLMKEAELEPEPNHVVHASANLKLAQRHYQARMLELRELIAQEEANFKRIILEIEDIRAGRWDNKIKAKISGLPLVEGTSQVPKSTSNQEGPQGDELSTSDLSGVTDSTSSRSHTKEEVSSKAKEIISSPEPISDKERDTTGLAEPEEVVPDSRDLVNQVLSQKLSGAHPLHIATNLQGKTNTEDDGSGDDSTHVRRTPRRQLSSIPVAKVTVHPRGTRSHQTPSTSSRPSGEAVLERIQSTPSEYQDVSRSEINTSYISPLESDSHSSTEKSKVEGKRKASLSEGMESPRDKKKSREQSEPPDDDDTGGVTRRRDRLSTPADQAAFRRFQSVVNLIHSQISQHRNGNIFHNPIKPSDAPDYHEIVKRPMDLKTIKARVRDGMISNAIEFQRDVFLMFANAMMFNRPGSDIHHMAEEMMLESESHINTLRTAEMTHRI